MKKPPVELPTGEGQPGFRSRKRLLASPLLPGWDVRLVLGPPAYLLGFPYNG